MKLNVFESIKSAKLGYLEIFIGRSNYLLLLRIGATLELPYKTKLHCTMDNHDFHNKL